MKPAGQEPRVDGLDAVAFTSTSRGWAAGRGAIIATTDGGATWTQQYKGRADISSLVFADEQHGWAVASDSLLRTADGGATWSPAGEPEGLALTSVDFTSAEEGWGIAYPAGTLGEPALGALVSTTDGGSSWAVVKQGVADSICASGGELVAGAGSKVLDSTDGGATWSTLLDAAGGPGAQWFTATVQCPDLQSIWVLFEGGGAAGSQAYAAYASADAGVAWQPVVVAPMLVGSDPAFANVTPLDAYPGPFAAVSASEAIFLGQCPACNPQHVTVLRTQERRRALGTPRRERLRPDRPGVRRPGSRLDDDPGRGSGGAALGDPRHDRRRPLVAPRVSVVDIEPLHGRHPADTPAS